MHRMRLWSRVLAWNLHFLWPEGEIRVQAIFRNVRESRGMGVEFVSMGGREFDLILAKDHQETSAGITSREKRYHWAL